MSAADVTPCQECGAPLDVDDVSWQGTVNFTPDVFVFGGQFFEYDESIGEAAADWCNGTCFARWLARHVAEIDLDRDLPSPAPAGEGSGATQ